VYRQEEANMPTPTFASDVARELYGLEPTSIEPLDRYHHDLRGIYRVRDAQDGAWVLRIKQGIEEYDSLTHTARLLDWMAEQRYPAPLVRRTLDQQPVSLTDGWAIMLLSYVEGSVLGMSSVTDFAAFGQAVGRLHSLQVGDPSSFAQSRCHPAAITTAAQQLAIYRANLPPAFQPLADNLHASMRTLQQVTDPQLVITHGDCWYQNAIKTGPGQVTLIDWDNVGIGWPLLDLGNLLLTSHFDPSQPLVLEPNTANIKAMLQGYQQHCGIAPEAQAHIADAMRFLLAFQLGSYIGDNTLIQHKEFPFVLEKLQARYQATQPIADLAAPYFRL
jgi:Ser/Thr protein kinase RdoA (MazF antagonist)